MRELIRPELRELTAYDIPVRAPGIWLNANESPWDINEVMFVQNVNRYPEQVTQLLLEQLCAIYQVQADQLLLTRGSDEGIDILVRLFCRPYQDEVIICPPTFGMYQQSVKLQGAKLVTVPLLVDKGFQWDLQKIKQSISSNTKMIFICSPNNPTGNVIPPEEILALLNFVNEKVLVVIDEAYIEFAQNESMTSYISQYSNLVILRTLSKAFGLADLRCGMVISQAPLIDMLQNLMPPYPFSAMTLKIINMATSQHKLQQVNKNIALIKQQREWMLSELGKLKCVDKIYSSEANFLLVMFKDATSVLESCQQNNIYLRDFSAIPGLMNGIRISIGLENQNQQLLAVLKK
ncbi:histidinol-phosphate transaminase [Candidatus Berkiella aquae]|uniref:Histidinol-phosphate aminotransferase n=1 Tax=Candidatus Berkiella aquae TaxID=295108 RepID=A0A0Q9YY68_9GAMM|nr:histidinol-phosphate transaminase [Candidatus Berkiella aquae]MCS5710406.1 histidinol-phosphate transaminase [Candidatus Berkiella aquae]